jgi:sigma-B regulation protein RsbU (phosphoserine phosphatase)
MSNKNVTSTSKTPTIMVVDDEEMVTVTLATYLELETDYHIQTYQSPLAALAALHKRPVDLIISDFLMPEMDGIEFLRQAKSSFPDTPAILLTGYADKENAIKAINEVGLFQYVEKPWDNEHLKVTIRNGIQNKNLREVLEHKVRELDDVLLEKDSLAQENKMLQQELALARNVQQSLLPKSCPCDFGIAVSGKYLPALDIGGDFYDCIAMQNDKLAVLIADVTGHGVQAALLTALLKSSFATFKNTSASPAEILTTMNEFLYRILPINLFVAGMVVIIDMRSGECALSNAGVPHPFVIRKQGQIERIPANGLLLGIIDIRLYSPGEQFTLKLAKGDCLIIYTDGLSEAENAAGDFFEDRLVETLQANGESGMAALDGLVASARRFADGDFRWDDITMVSIEKTG